MALHSPIILIEDDANDIEVITTAVAELGYVNPVRAFTDAQAALDYLHATHDKPFIILCDIRMPRINGLALRRELLDSRVLKERSIPFVFFTAAVSADIIKEAYDMQVQGFYEKAVSYTEVKDQLSAILRYWSMCLHPNRDE